MGGSSFNIMDIINIKTEVYGDPVIYIGRSNFFYKLEGSVLANPYQVNKKRTLEESLLLYKKWVLQMYSLKKGSVYTELVRLAKLEKEGKKFALGCWCRPNNCHGDIIKQVIEFMVKTNVV